MSKIQVTTALERQLPEFIREDYATFVKFLQAYYEFLGQTNSRNLEDLRSIDRTLDDFVAKFKKELAAIFPTGNIPNERMFLEHISDFYNSRGSLESYKLLFRVLFNKDVDIFYPSTQILRVSDGKWVQEKSVFVKRVSGDIFDLKGQIIKLNTSKKVIEVFSPNVVLYRDDIYEVFIDKQYYNDIATGDTVSYGTASGYILPCPSKYKIVKEGSGFEVGSIYNLPTSSGNGSVVKITRVGSLGEIKTLQVISFGLDYTTNFYAQLSNKSTQALAYYHPITQYTAGTPRNALLEPTASYGPNPASQEQLSDYVEFGEMIRQDYFKFDSNYVSQYNTLLGPTRSDAAQTVWFADTTYVGEIIASFYTNSGGVVIDDTVAEIKVTLGSVALYPGYYSTNDGFVSDEIFIQDNNYYQQFSYVIKVEEQLENYKDIIKSLLQPVGLKLFGEYNIYKNFDVSASPLLAFVRRQFADQINQLGDFYASAMLKSLSDTHVSASNYAETYIKDVTKLLQDTPILSESIKKDVTKQVDQDVLNSLVEEVKKIVSKLLEETQGLSEEVKKTVTKQIDVDVINTFIETLKKDATKQIDVETINSLVEEVKKIVSKLLEETQAVTEGTIGKTFTPDTKTETIGSVLETLIAKAFTQKLDDSATATQSEGKSLDWSSGVGGTFYKVVTPSDTFDRVVAYKRSFDDSDIIPTETEFKFGIGLLKSEASTSSDTFDRVVSYSRSFEDSGIVYAEPKFAIDRVILPLDSFYSSDTYSQIVSFKRDFSDSQNLIDQQALLVTPATIAESVSLGADTFILGTLFARSFADSINSYIEGSTLYFNAYSETTTTADLTDDYFSEGYAVVTTLTIT